jgi:uncharacterized protein (TIGR04141 family)
MATKQRLNIFLLKEASTIQNAVKKEGVSAKSIPISDDVPFTGLIWIESRPSKPPKWKTFIQEGTPNDLSSMSTQNSSALIVIEAEDRIFCIAFGSARHWIEDENIERRFGMLTTLNTVQFDKIRSIDREEFETVTRMTRSQTSISASIDNFGLDVQRDLVRSVTGEPQDKDFATHITGADNLILNVSIKFAELATKCGEALLHYKKENYRERYAWIDNFQRVQDKALVKQLEENLFVSMQDETSESIFLSPPILMDTQESHEFRYPSERKTTPAHSDLRLSELLTLFDRNQLSPDWMKSIKSKNSPQTLMTSLENSQCLTALFMR